MTWLAGSMVQVRMVWRLVDVVLEVVDVDMKEGLVGLWEEAVGRLGGVGLPFVLRAAQGRTTVLPPSPSLQSPSLRSLHRRRPSPSSQDLTSSSRETTDGEVDDPECAEDRGYTWKKGKRRRHGNGRWYTRSFTCSIGVPKRWWWSVRLCETRTAFRRGRDDVEAESVFGVT